MKTWKALLLTIPLLLTAAGTTKAQDNTYGFLSNTTTNKNRFYGMDFGDKYMNQTYAEMGKNSINGAFWTNFNVKEKKIEEVDFYLNKSFSICPDSNTNITLTPGFGYYTFPNSEMKDSQEIYLKASTSSLPVNLNFKIGKAFGEDSGEGIIVHASADKSFSLTDKLSVTGKLDGAYSENYFSTGKGFMYAAANASVNYNLAKGLDLSLTGIYQERLADGFKGIVKSEPYFTFNVSHSF